MSGTVPDLEGRQQSEWAVRYRQKATHFKEMASSEVRRIRKSAARQMSRSEIIVASTYPKMLVNDGDVSEIRLPHHVEQIPQQRDSAKRRLDGEIAQHTNYL